MAPTQIALNALAAKRLMTKADFDSLPPEDQSEFADINSDNVVNTQDGLIINREWGPVTPSVPPITPEPPPGTYPSHEITWLGRNNAPRKMVLNLSAQETLLPRPPAGKGYDFTNRDDLYSYDVDLGSLPPNQDLIHCGNSGSADRCVVDSLTGSCSQYLAYIGYASDWYLYRLDLFQLTGATQHGLRSACNRLLVESCQFNTELGGKCGLWYYGPQMCVIGTPQAPTIFRGGHIWFGAMDNDMGGAGTSGVKVLWRHAHHIFTRHGNPMYEAITVRKGIQELVMEDGIIEAPGTYMNIVSECLGDIILRRMQVRRPGQSARPMTADDVVGNKTNLIIE